MILFFSLILITLLFFLSIFFSLSETALTSLSKYKVKKYVALKGSMNIAFQKWLQNPQELLVTILISNNFTNLAISILATFIALNIFFRFARELIELATWLFVTLFILIVAEILPKIYGKRNPEKSVLSIIKPLTMVNKIVYPVLFPSIWIINKILKIRQSMPLSKTSSLSVDEIKHIFSESVTGGAIERETTKMIEGALRFSKIKVKEIMIPVEKIEAIDIDKDNETVINQLIITGRSRVPVFVKNIDNITGMVYLKDLINKDQLENLEFSKDLIRPVYFVNQDDDVDTLLQEFKKGTTHCAIVVDNKKTVKGFISLEDILEEIVGETVDEYDLFYPENKTWL